MKTIKKQLKCCYGISSKADKFFHIPMFDYDNIEIDDVIDHLKYIQEDLNLSNIYVMKSTHGYNALCLDLHSLGMCYSIGTSIVSPCDRDFFKYGLERGYYTLRFDEDKELVNILENDSHRYTKSLAHKLFLEWYFNITIDCDNTFNDNTKLKIIQYPSNKNGYHLQDSEVTPYINVVTGSI